MTHEELELVFRRHKHKGQPIDFSEILDNVTAVSSPSISASISSSPSPSPSRSVSASPSPSGVLPVLLGIANFGQYSSEEYDNGNIIGTHVIDWNNGKSQYINLTGDCILTFTNPISNGDYKLHITGAFIPIFPSNCRFPGDVTPTPSAILGRKDIWTFNYCQKEGLYDGAMNPSYAIT